jgi:hypothetical protein
VRITNHHSNRHSDVCSSVHDHARNDVGGQRRAVSIPAISADLPAMVGHHVNVGDSRLDFHVHSALQSACGDDPGNPTHQPNRS